MTTHREYFLARAYWVTAAIAGGAPGAVVAYFTHSSIPLIAGIGAGLIGGLVLAGKNGSSKS